MDTRTSGHNEFDTSVDVDSQYIYFMGSELSPSAKVLKESQLQTFPKHSLQDHFNRSHSIALPRLAWKVDFIECPLYVCLVWYLLLPLHVAIKSICRC